MESTEWIQMIEKSTGMEIENADNSSGAERGLGAMTELILIRIYKQCVDMLLCRIRKQNGMISGYD